MRRILIVLVSYMVPLLLLQRAEAAAVACTSSMYQCISEGAGPDTRAYAGQRGASETKRGASGALSATATSLTVPTQNGFLHFYSVHDFTPPYPVGYGMEWMEAGFGNGIFNGNAGYPKTSDYNWFTELYSWCNQGPNGTVLWYGAGGYTPGTTHLVEVWMPDMSYDCGSGGTTFVYGIQSYFNGQLGATGWLSTYGSDKTPTAITEYYPYSYLNPVGRVCYGSGAPTQSCQNSSYPVKRLQSATWYSWDSSDTAPVSTFGYQRNVQTANWRFNVTSPY
jgi:hypothetical protein